MKLIRKITAAAKNPALGAAYLRWTVAKVLLGRPPKRRLHDNVKLGGWLNFSEFWSFREGMPQFEREFLKNLRQSSPGHFIAFDVGANIGTFTCLLPSFGDVEIHAFEPVPETFCRLKANVKRNGLLDCCHLNCMAVGKERDILHFRIEPDSPAENQLAQAADQSPQRPGVSIQSVASTNLDEYCKSEKIGRIDFLKIDVEGMEPYVLQGAHQFLRERKVRAILIEICPVNLRTIGFSPADLYREFESIRYSPHALNDDGRPGAKLSLAEIEAITLANVILLPDA